MYTCMYMCVYIYIYRERERGRERDTHTHTSAGQQFRSLARIRNNCGSTWRKPKTEVVR